MAEVQGDPSGHAVTDSGWWIRRATYVLALTFFVMLFGFFGATLIVTGITWLPDEPSLGRALGDVVALALGLLLSGAVFWVAFRREVKRWVLFLRGPRTTAEVIEIRQREEGDNTAFYVDFDYSLGGVPMPGTLKSWDRPGGRRNPRLPDSPFLIAYDPRNPEQTLDIEGWVLGKRRQLMTSRRSESQNPGLAVRLGVIVLALGVVVPFGIAFIGSAIDTVGDTSDPVGLVVGGLILAFGIALFLIAARLTAYAVRPLRERRDGFLRRDERLH
jgi:hypothetical protein